MQSELDPAAAPPSPPHPTPGDGFTPLDEAYLETIQDERADSARGDAAPKAARDAEAQLPALTPDTIYAVPSAKKGKKKQGKKRTGKTRTPRPAATDGAEAGTQAAGEGVVSYSNPVHEVPGAASSRDSVQYAGEDSFDIESGADSPLQKTTSFDKELPADAAVVEGTRAGQRRSGTGRGGGGREDGRMSLSSLKGKKIRNPMARSGGGSPNSVDSQEESQDHEEHIAEAIRSRDYLNDLAQGSMQARAHPLRRLTLPSAGTRY